MPQYVHHDVYKGYLWYVSLGDNQDQFNFYVIVVYLFTLRVVTYLQGVWSTIT